MAGPTRKIGRPKYPMSEISWTKTTRWNNALCNFTVCSVCCPWLSAVSSPPNNPYWLFFLEFRVIADILFAQKWTADLVELYRALYAEHLVNFKLLFPTFNLLPKHRYLTHYGTFALNTGPPYHIMTSSEEIKGNFFKRYASVMCNFKNAPRSPAQKHQCFSYLSLSSHRLLNTAVETVKATDALLSSFSCCDALKFDFGVVDEEVTIACTCTSNKNRPTLTINEFLVLKNTAAT